MPYSYTLNLHKLFTPSQVYLLEQQKDFIFFMAKVSSETDEK